LNTDNGAQLTSSRFSETLGRLGITDRRTAYHHAEGDSYIERFYRSWKKKRKSGRRSSSIEEARTSMATWKKKPPFTFQQGALKAESHVGRNEKPNLLIERASRKAQRYDEFLVASWDSLQIFLRTIRPGWPGGIALPRSRFS